MSEIAYIETWKMIGAYMDKSERWCRYMAQRQNDPLPVYKVGGMVRMNEQDVLAWLSRQKEHRPVHTPQQRALVKRAG